MKNWSDFIKNKTRCPCSPQSSTSPTTPSPWPTTPPWTTPLSGSASCEYYLSVIWDDQHGCNIFVPVLGQIAMEIKIVISSSETWATTRSSSLDRTPCLTCPTWGVSSSTTTGQCQSVTKSVKKSETNIYFDSLPHRPNLRSLLLNNNRVVSI